MNKEYALSVRRIRRDIVAICNSIYKKEWNVVKKRWESLDGRLSDIILKDDKCYDYLLESRSCAAKGNDVRLRDLLLYEIDSYLTEILCSFSKEDRLILINDAQRQNEEALRLYYNHIFVEISKETDVSRVGCAYIGTENAGLSVKECGRQFRLFSFINPWLESADFVNEMDKRKFNEICVLGFGGGYVIRELERRYPEAKIRVYLPNRDIFRTVVNYIEVSDILQNKNLEMCFDSVCLDFFSTVKEKMGRDKNFGFYIDRQELRASTGNIELSERLMAEYSGEWKSGNGAEEIRMGSAGENIERYIKGLVANG